MTEEMPFVSFSNEELASAPPVQETSKCPECGKDVKVQDSEQADNHTAMQFISCCDKTFLVGIGGKDVTNSFT